MSEIIGNIDSELKAYEQERKSMPFIIKKHQENIASELINGKMGNSINETFNGKGKTKIPLVYRLKYNFRKIVNNLISTF